MAKLYVLRLEYSFRVETDAGAKAKVDQLLKGLESKADKAVLVQVEEHTTKTLKQRKVPLG